MNCSLLLTTGKEIQKLSYLCAVLFTISLSACLESSNKTSSGSTNSTADIFSDAFCSLTDEMSTKLNAHEDIGNFQIRRFRKHQDQIFVAQYDAKIEGDGKLSAKAESYNYKAVQVHNQSDYNGIIQESDWSIAYQVVTAHSPFVLIKTEYLSVEYTQYIADELEKSKDVRKNAPFYVYFIGEGAEQFVPCKQFNIEALPYVDMLVQSADSTEVNSLIADAINRSKFQNFQTEGTLLSFALSVHFEKNGIVRGILEPVLQGPVVTAHDRQNELFSTKWCTSPSWSSQLPRVVIESGLFSDTYGYKPIQKSSDAFQFASDIYYSEMQVDPSGEIESIAFQNAKNPTVTKQKIEFRTGSTDSITYSTFLNSKGETSSWEVVLDSMGNKWLIQHNYKYNSPTPVSIKADCALLSLLDITQQINLTKNSNLLNFLNAMKNRYQ